MLEVLVCWLSNVPEPRTLPFRQISLYPAALLSSVVVEVALRPEPWAAVVTFVDLVYSSELEPRAQESLRHGCHGTP